MARLIWQLKKHLILFLTCSVIAFIFTTSAYADVGFKKLANYQIFIQLGQAEKYFSQMEVDAIPPFIKKLPSILTSQLVSNKLNEEENIVSIFIYPDRIVVENKWESLLYAEEFKLASELDANLLYMQRYLLRAVLFLYEQKHQISKSSEWKSISGWQSKLGGLIDVANNRDHRAYANVDAMLNPTQDFIRAAEYYILPPASTMELSIKCRMPTKFQFIKTLLTDYLSPLDGSDYKCRTLEEGFLDDVEFYSPLNGERVDMGPINEETVTGFELLYATPGTGDASEIAGHLLLRIKLNNNPDSSQSGKENPKDLVVSFLANTRSYNEPKSNDYRISAKVRPIQKECKTNWFNIVEDGQQDFNALHSILQSLKGLSGGFLTMMDRQTLAHAIKNYTIEEDRNILRFELLLSQQQKRNLLERLYLAKKNYNAEYYFFDQNCASVLVKVIGQGIGNEEIANFDPFVSPPNSLVTMFMRNKLIKPVYPSFYSYRQKGYIAQQILKQSIASYEKLHPNYNWFSVHGLFDDNESKRLSSLVHLYEILSADKQLEKQFYRLASLVQEAEMSFENKELVCELYTSSVTAQARKYQGEYLKFNGNANLKNTSISMDQLLAKRYILEEAADYQQGVPHTKLLSHSFGLGYYENQVDSTPILVLEAALDMQSMGSISKIAMQRGNYVTLGKASVSFDARHRGATKIRNWQLTALDIRKFKERLNYIPSYFEPSGSIGLGLSFLDFKGDASLKLKHGSLIGGEILFNLMSSKNNNDYAFLSLGGDIHRHMDSYFQNTIITTSIRGETLVSFDQRRKWQWRTNFEHMWDVENKSGREVEMNSSLVYRVGGTRVDSERKPLSLFKLTAKYYKQLKSNINSQMLSSQSIWFGVEFNPF